MQLSVEYIHRFLTSFTFSIIVETLVLLIVLKLLIKCKDLEIWKIISAGAVATFMTIPYVWFVFPYLFEWERTASHRVSEPFVMVVEAIFYRLFLKISWPLALGVSIAANLASYVLGPILRANGLWIYW